MRETAEKVSFAIVMDLQRSSGMRNGLRQQILFSDYFASCLFMSVTSALTIIV